MTVRQQPAPSTITATDLLKMGVPEGPAIGAILEMLETNALDYPETTQDGQVTLVKEWLQNTHNQD